VSKADELGYGFIEIYSNLTLANGRILSSFLKHRANIATSFYSVNPEIHDMITQHKGSFVLTTRAIAQVLSLGIPLRIGMVDMGQGDDEMQKAIEFLLSLGISRERINVDYVRPVGRGRNAVENCSEKEALCGACWKGKLAVSSDGAVHPCVFARDVVVGSINAERLSRLVQNKDLRYFRESSFDSWDAGRERVSMQCGPGGPEPHNCSPS